MGDLLWRRRNTEERAACVDRAEAPEDGAEARRARGSSGGADAGPAEAPEGMKRTRGARGDPADARRKRGSSGGTGLPASSLGMFPCIPFQLI